MLDSNTCTVISHINWKIIVDVNILSTTHNTIIFTSTPVHQISYDCLIFTSVQINATKNGIKPILDFLLADMNYVLVSSVIVSSFLSFNNKTGLN